MLLPSGKVEQPLFFVLKLADVIAMWQDGTATFVLKKMADVITRWQVLKPLFHLCDGRCYSQVVDGITTQSGWCYLVDVMTKLADGIAMFFLGKYFLIHIFVYIILQDKHFLQTWGSHVWKLTKACLYREIICSVLKNILNTWDQTEWEVSICILEENMVKKMWKSFANGRKWRIRWWTSLTIEDLP